MRKRVKVFFNKTQIKYMQALQKMRWLIAGRGFGKSTLIAWIIYEMLRALPRGKIFFASTTVEQIKNSTLPAVEAKLSEFGLVKGVHYVVCQRPPEHYDTPISPPEDYETCLTFWNGFTIVLLSLARPKSKRGGSYDGGIIDEAAFNKAEPVKQVLLPMVRGNTYRFLVKKILKAGTKIRLKNGKVKVLKKDTEVMRPNSWHQVVCFMSSKPRKPEGFWIYEYRDMAQENPKEILWLEASAWIS